MIEPPISTLFILLLSFLAAIIQGFLTIKLSNPKISKKMSQEVRNYKKELQSARRLSDNKTIRILEKKTAYIHQLETKLSSNRF